MKYLLAAGAGAALYAAFPPISWWPLAVLGVALLVIALQDSRGWQAARVCWVAGLTFFAPLVHWMSVLGPDAWLALAVGLSLWFAGMGWALSLTLTLRWWPLAVPAVWVLQEWLRSRFPWGGLGWGRLAFSQPDTPLTGWVSLGGAPLLSFVVAAVGCSLAVALRNPRRTPVAALVAAALLLAPLVAGPATSTVQAPSSSRLALIQGNVPAPGLDFLGRPLAVLTNHERTTAALAAAVQAGNEPPPDAVIWPENSSDIDPVLVPRARQLVTQAADSAGVPLLVGTVQEVPGQPDRVANVGLVWEPGRGPTDAYIKQHPVPFGEFLPLRPLLSSLITRFDRVPRDFIAGDSPGVLQLGPARIADVICFEVSSDEIVRTSIREGGRALVVQTNNATYATTAQPEQQFDISRLRARETGRAVLVAATTGVTAAIDDTGAYQRLPVLQPGWLNAEVTLRDTWTPAVHFGGWVDAALSLLAACAIAAGIRVSRSRETGSK